MLKKTKLSLILSSFAIFASSQVMAATVYKTDDTSFAVGGRVQANINSKYASRKGEKGDISTKARLNLKGKKFAETESAFLHLAKLHGIRKF